jgi:hypothetical protein
LGALIGGGQTASNIITRQTVDWTPTCLTLLDDLEAGYYAA